MEKDILGLLGWSSNTKPICSQQKAFCRCVMYFKFSQIPLNQSEQARRDMLYFVKNPSVEMAILPRFSIGCTSCPW